MTLLGLFEIAGTAAAAVEVIVILSRANTKEGRVMFFFSHNHSHVLRGGTSDLTTTIFSRV